MAYRLADAHALSFRLKAALPNAKVAQYRDYGWSVDVWDDNRFIVACQPARDDIGQEEVFRSFEEIVAFMEVPYATLH